MNILFDFCVCENEFQVSSRNGKAVKGNVKVITMLYIFLQTCSGKQHVSLVSFENIFPFILCRVIFSWIQELLPFIR